jgi:hypothetical protein
MAGSQMEGVVFVALVIISVAGGNQMGAVAPVEPVTISVAAGRAGKHLTTSSSGTLRDKAAQRPLA